MSKRDLRRWAYRQYQGDIHPWPLWLRWALAIAALLAALKLLGVW